MVDGQEDQLNGPTVPATPTVATSQSSNRGSSRAPPSFDSTMTYELWKKQLQLWQICCRLDKNQQASELILSLSGKAREAALELDVNEVHAEDGVDKVLKKLDGLYLKDENQLIYVSLKKFEQYKRSKDQSIDDYINEFERLYNKLKHYKIVYPDAAVAYRLLESANLPQDRSELIRTTVSKLEYSLVKIQLRKLEDSAVKTADSFEVTVKNEPDDTFYGRGDELNRGRASGRGGFSRGRGGRFNGRNRSRGRGYTRGACFRCKDPGHYINDCPLNNEGTEGAAGKEEDTLYNEVRYDAPPRDHHSIKIQI